MLLVDVSGSRAFGTQKQLKRDLMAEIAAVLSFSTIQNNDKIGMIMFSDKIEKFIPPKKGRQHTLRIIRELIEFEPVSTKTDISEALRYLTNAIKKKSTSFVISDFLDYDHNKGAMNFEEALRIANRKHDVVALRIFDQRDKNLPAIGLVKMLDAETGSERWIDTSDYQTRNAMHQWWYSFENKLSDVFKKSNVDNTMFFTGNDFVKPLTQLFKNR